MKCLYCDEEIKYKSIYSLLIKEDLLCKNCRDAMAFHHKEFKLDNLHVETFYEYNSLFKDILLQYKECYDEALKDVFLYQIDDYIKLKYFGYKIVYVPSTAIKLNERGFNHLKEIFSSLNFKEVEAPKMIEDITQINKTYKQREKMKNNYIYDGDFIDKLLIVDDVCTSGSSLIGMYNAYKGKCKKIRAVVLSRT